MSARLPLQVLVVDDDDVDRERVRRLLDRCSLECDVHEASTGAEALDRVQLQPFDCVMLDHHLGDSDGADLLQRLHRQARRDCPIIMITGAGSEALAARAMRDGAADYLLKTQLSVETLAGALNRCLEHHRVRAELAALHQQLEQRVQQQAAVLQQRERDLQALIDNAPTVMGYWDRDLRCRFGNRPHAEWFGVTAAELPGRALQDVLGPGLARTSRGDVEAALQGQTREVEWWLPPADGRPERHLQVQLDPDRDSGGVVVGLYMTMTDVSPIKRARDAAESAARTKSAFLANMSHEIRTPMNAIIGLARLALDEDLPPRARDFLDKVHTSALALMGILDDVLDYSKIEAGQLHVERITIDLPALIARQADLFRARLEQKGLALRVELPPSVPRQVLADPLRLSQVLTNLVGNAVKFTSVGQVRLQVALDDGARPALRFMVADTGIGIAANRQAHLFEAFEQGDSSITRRFGGTGLGLSICRRLVQLMGGEIGMHSRVGHGSTFWFTLPLQVGEAATGTAAVPLPPPPATVDLQALQGRRVLLAEDNPLNQIVASELLRRLGLEVTVVDNGASAVAAVAASASAPFDAVLMDLHMPELDGLEAARRIRALTGSAQLPVIGLTAAVMAEDRARCLEAGMVDHVAKPIMPERLRQVLLQWMQPVARSPALVLPEPPPAAPAAATMAAAPGIDLEGLRQRLHASEALIWRLLSAYVQRSGDADEQVARLLAQGDRAAARALLHDLRGSASTLGLQELAAAALELEQALAQPTLPEAAQARFGQRYRQGMEALRAMMAEKTAQDAHDAAAGSAPP
jgi:PAS domain S-box-containing protein